MKDKQTKKSNVFFLLLLLFFILGLFGFVRQNGWQTEPVFDWSVTGIRQSNGVRFGGGTHVQKQPKNVEDNLASQKAQTRAQANEKADTKPSVPDVWIEKQMLPGGNNGSATSSSDAVKPFVPKSAPAPKSDLKQYESGVKKGK